VPVLVVAVLVNPFLYFSVNWLPTYFAQQRGLAPGSQLGWILTAIYLGLGLGNFLCGTVVLALSRREYPLLTAQKIMFLSATVPLAACAAVPFVGLGVAIGILIAVNIGLGVWTAIYLTMVQDVLPSHVSSSLGLLSGCGSLAGALAMWAVGKITRETGSFLIPMVGFAIAGVVAAIAGCVANREQPALKEVAHDQIA
jgi:MFS family permease